MLAHATAKYDAVAAAEHSTECANVFACPIAVQLNGELCLGRGICKQCAHVTRAARNSQQARFAIKPRNNLRAAEAEPLLEIGNDGRIDVARPRSHDKAFERRETH